jgi:hypothetical protein
MPNEFIARNGLIAQNNSTITGSLTVTGTITATTLVAQTVTSSTSWITGSTKFGSITSNTHQFTGSILQSGSLAYFAGNVGIGTASPNSILEISQTTPIFRIQASAADQFHGIEFRQGAGFDAFIKQLPQTGEFRISNGRDGSWGGFITLYTDTNERMRITSGGNVGIGTTSPATRLHISKTDGSNELIAARIQNNLGYAEFGVQSNYARILANGALLYAGSDGAQFHYYNGSVVMTIGTGNVGIGTTSPNAKLNVRGTEGSGTVTPQEDLLHIGGNELGGVGGYAGIRLAGTAGTSYGVYIRGVKTTSYGNFWNDALTFSVTRTNTETTIDEVMRITSGGYVGIGTTSPNEKFHVAGNIHAYAAGGIDADLYASTAAGSTTIAIRSSGASIFNGGNVGIGTTSPGAKLDISGSARITNTSGSGNFLSIRSTTGNYGGQIDFYENSLLSHAIISTGANNTFYIRDEYNAATRLLINNVGNVGIGTTSPAHLLDVVKAGANAIRVQNTDSSADAYFIAQNTTGTSFFGTNNIGPYIYTVSALAMQFYTNNAERMRITSGGNVGIGTTSPVVRLDYGSTTGQAFHLYTSDADYYGINMAQYDSESFSTNIFSGNNGLIKFRTASGTTTQSTRMTIVAGGNVGIGTTSPIDRLDVSGDVVFGSATERLSLRSGGIGFNRKVSDGAIYDSSRFAYQFNHTPSATNTSDYLAVQVYSGSGALITGGALVINGVGNVGIGTLTPAYKLEVNGATGISGQTTVTSDSVEQIIIRRSSNTNQQLLVGRYSSYGYLQAVTQGSSFDPLILNPNGGNVGIGTTSPSSKLFIIGSTDIINATSTTTDARINIGHSANGGYVGYANIGAGSAANTFYVTNGSGTIGSGITMNNDGNVGIGTTSPANKLHTYGSNPRNYIHDSGTGYPILQLANDSGQFYFAIDNSTGGGFGSGYARYIYGSGNYPMIFVTNDTERIRIIGNGNVGIGTTSPLEKLDVRGSIYTIDSEARIKFKSTGGSGREYDFIGGNDGVFYFYDRTATTYRYVINASGNVGIGTTSPVSTLDVNGSINIPSGFNLTWGGAYGANIPTLAGVSGASGYLAIYPGGSSSSEKVRVTNAGNVGIGTSSPVSLLNIHGSAPYLVVNDTSANDFGIKIRHAGSETHGLHLIYSANSATASISNTYPATSGQQWGDIHFRQNSGDGTMVTRMMIKADGGGNVGIGTTSPSFKLHVTGYGFFSGANQGVLLGESNCTIVGDSATTNAANMLFYTANTERMRITSGGNVGIGTTSPSYRLHIVTNAVAGRQDMSNISRTTGNWVRFTNPQYSTDASMGLILRVFPDSDARQGAGIIASGGSNNACTNLDLFVTTSPDGLGGTSYSALNLNGLSGVATFFNNVSAPIFTSAGGRGTSYGFRLPDWQIYNTSGNALAFNNYTTDFLTISSAGNVGIGTTSPGATLQIGFQNNTTSEMLRLGVLYGTSNAQRGTISWSDGSGITGKIWTIFDGNTMTKMNFGGLYNNGYDQGTYLTIQGNGNVGIGTTSPAYRLDVTGNIGINGRLFAFNSATYTQITDPAGGIKLYLGASGDPGNYYDNTNHNFRSAGGGTTYAVINTNGNLGIGRTSPSYKLDVSGSTRIFGYLLGVDNSTTIKYVFTNDGGASYINSGNVGIGTTTPASKLQVAGSTNVVNIAGSGSATASSIFSVDGNNGRLFEITDDLSDSIFSANTIAGLPVIEAFSDYSVRLGTYSATSGSTINITGSNVGIGTTNPLSRIEVYNSSEDRHFSAIGASPSLNLYSSNTSPVYGGTVGLATGTDAYLQGSAVGDLCILTRGSYSSGIILFGSGSTKNASISTAGTITARGDMIAYGTPSDISFKTNIVPIQGSLDIIQKLEPVSFTWKEDTESNKLTNIKDDLGFIAQQVQEVLPELVRENDNGTLSLRERGIIPLLVGAIKELKAEIDILKNK